MSAARLARIVVRCYPRAWRTRYEPEMLGLLEDSSVRWRHLVDLASGASWEWVQTSDAARFVVAVSWAWGGWLLGGWVAQLLLAIGLSPIPYAQLIGVALQAVLFAAIFSMTSIPAIRASIRWAWGYPWSEPDRRPMTGTSAVALTLAIIAASSLDQWAPSQKPSGFEGQLFDSIPRWFSWFFLTSLTVDTWERVRPLATVSTSHTGSDDS